MAHLGFLSPFAKGHVYPMSALALRLRQRGHRVTFFGIADAEAFFREQGLDFVTIAPEAVPLGSSDQAFAALGVLKGQAGVRFSLKLFADMADVFFAALPKVIRASQVDALVIDQFFIGGATIADHLRLPYAHVSCALLFNLEKHLPPVTTDWPPPSNPLSRLRNAVALFMGQRFLKPLKVKVNAQRRAWQLAPYASFPNDAFAGHPQICQQPPGFEFPRRALPSDFHFTGPLHDVRHRADTDFPFYRLDGRRIIYASMGTLQNGLAWIFRVILKACEEACTALNAQLVLSLGGNFDPALFAGAAGNPVIVRFAPQLELLAQADLCITHAGLNTALESLAQGVPMIAIPITNDQPGVAARIAWSGTGKVIQPAQLTAARLRSAIEEILSTPAYTARAQRLRDEITALHSLDAASSIVESIMGK